MINFISRTLTWLCKHGEMEGRRNKREGCQRQVCYLQGIKQYSLFMCVARTLISWTASHTLVVWSITMVGHVKKSYGGLASFREIIAWYIDKLREIDLNMYTNSYGDMQFWCFQRDCNFWQIFDVYGYLLANPHMIKAHCTTYLLPIYLCSLTIYIHTFFFLYHKPLAPVGLIEAGWTCLACYLA